MAQNNDNNEMPDLSLPDLAAFPTSDSTPNPTASELCHEDPIYLQQRAIEAYYKGGFYRRESCERCENGTKKGSLSTKKGKRPKSKDKIKCQCDGGRKLLWLRLLLRHYPKCGPLKAYNLCRLCGKRITDRTDRIHYHYRYCSKANKTVKYCNGEHEAKIRFIGDVRRSVQDGLPNMTLLGIGHHDYRMLGTAGGGGGGDPGNGNNGYESSTNNESSTNLHIIKDCDIYIADTVTSHRNDIDIHENDIRGSMNLFGDENSNVVHNRNNENSNIAGRRPNASPTLSSAQSLESTLSFSSNMTVNMEEENKETSWNKNHNNNNNKNNNKNNNNTMQNDLFKRYVSGTTAPNTSNGTFITTDAGNQLFVSDSRNPYLCNDGNGIRYGTKSKYHQNLAELLRDIAYNECMVIVNKGLPWNLHVTSEQERLRKLYVKHIEMTGTLPSPTPVHVLKHTTFPNAQKSLSFRIKDIMKQTGRHQILMDASKKDRIHRNAIMCVTGVSNVAFFVLAIFHQKYNEKNASGLYDHIKLVREEYKRISIEIENLSDNYSVNKAWSKIDDKLGRAIAPSIWVRYSLGDLCHPLQNEYVAIVAPANNPPHFVILMEMMTRLISKIFGTGFYSMLLIFLKKSPNDLIGHPICDTNRMQFGQKGSMAVWLLLMRVAITTLFKIKSKESLKFIGVVLIEYWTVNGHWMDLKCFWAIVGPCCYSLKRMTSYPWSSDCVMNICANYVAYNWKLVVKAARIKKKLQKKYKKMELATKYKDHADDVSSTDNDDQSISSTDNINGKLSFDKDEDDYDDDTLDIYQGRHGISSELIISQNNHNHNNNNNNNNNNNDTLDDIILDELKSDESKSNELPECECDPFQSLTGILDDRYDDDSEKDEEEEEYYLSHSYYDTKIAEPFELITCNQGITQFTRPIAIDYNEETGTFWIQSLENEDDIFPIEEDHFRRICDVALRVLDRNISKAFGPPQGASFYCDIRFRTVTSLPIPFWEKIVNGNATFWIERFGVEKWEKTFKGLCFDLRNGVGAFGFGAFDLSKRTEKEVLEMKPWTPFEDIALGVKYERATDFVIFGQTCYDLLRRIANTNKIEIFFKGYRTMKYHMVQRRGAKTTDDMNEFMWNHREYNKYHKNM